MIQSYNLQDKCRQGGGRINPMQLVLVLVAGLMIASCSLAPGKKSGFPMVSPSASTTPEVSKTITLVSAVTRTPDPTSTQSPSIPAPTQPASSTEEDNEPIIIPTPTPLVPTPELGKEYDLVNWTPERENQLVNEMQAYPDGLGGYDRGYHDSRYYFDFNYARFAAVEASLRFPDSSFAEGWKWGQAYNMALMGAPQVIDAYARLISQGLNTEKIHPEQLTAWFNEHEPRLQLTLIPLEPPSGYVNAYLVEIADQQRYSGIYLWIVGKVSYQVFPLPSCDESSQGYNLVCENSDFGFSSADGINYTLKDLTGDGVAEIITEHTFFPGSGDALVTNFDIFNIQTVPPRKISLSPSLPIKMERTWNLSSGQGEKPELTFDFIFDSQVCPSINFQLVYRLSGKSFVLIKQNNPKPDELVPDGWEGCMDAYFNNLLHAVERGETDNLGDVEQWLAGWPHWKFAIGEWMGMNPAPDDRDGARFTLGIYLALNGEREAAIREMKTILSNPVIPSSRWIDIANKFLKNYPPSGDLQQACMATRICLKLLGEYELIMLYKYHAGGPTILDYLQANGVPILASGSLDLNQDGWKDYWFTKENPDNGGTNVSFLLYWEGHYEEFDLGRSLEKATPQIEISAPFQEQPTLMVGLGNEATKYILYKSDGGTVQLNSYPIYLQERVTSAADDAETKQLAGRPAAEVYDSLRNSSPMADELDRYQLYIPNYSINPLPRWYYLYGLVNELEGNSEVAVQSYTTAWIDFPNSPYALMAIAKLQRRDQGEGSDR